MRTLKSEICHALLDLLGVPLYVGCDRERSPCRALGIVLMGPGQAEESRDPVTHVRLHHAAELLHRMAHPADALADDKLGLVGA